MTTSPVHSDTTQRISTPFSAPQVSLEDKIEKLIRDFASGSMTIDEAKFQAQQLIDDLNPLEDIQSAKTAFPSLLGLNIEDVQELVIKKLKLFVITSIDGKDNFLLKELPELFSIEEKISIVISTYLRTSHSLKLIFSFLDLYLVVLEQLFKVINLQKFEQISKTIIPLHANDWLVLIHNDSKLLEKDEIDIALKVIKEMIHRLIASPRLKEHNFYNSNLNSLLPVHVHEDFENNIKPNISEKKFLEDIEEENEASQFNASDESSSESDETIVASHTLKDPKDLLIAIKQLIKHSSSETNHSASTLAAVKKLLFHIKESHEFVRVFNRDDYNHLIRKCYLYLLKLNIEPVRQIALAQLKKLFSIGYLFADVKNNQFHKILLIEKKLRKIIIATPFTASQFFLDLLDLDHKILEHLWEISCFMQATLSNTAIHETTGQHTLETLPHLDALKKDSSPILYLQNRPAQLLEQRLTDRKIEKLIDDINRTSEKFASPLPLMALEIVNKLKTGTYSYAELAWEMEK